MKLLLLLLLPIFCQSQTTAQFQCHAKMTELAEWRPVNVEISLESNIITVHETIGIELKIQVDKVQDINTSRLYTLHYNNNDNVRMAHPIVPTNGVFIVSVLNWHYQCQGKTDQ